jgi:hypothetical protein
LAENPQKLEYVRPGSDLPELVQKSFALDLHAGRNVKSLIIFLLILLAGMASIFAMISR